MNLEHLGMDNSQLDDVITQVRERYADIEWPNVWFDSLWRGIGDRTPIENRQAIVTEFNGVERVASICSDDYMLIPHEWAVHRFEESLKTMPQYGAPQVKVNLYSDGAKLRASATFPEVEIKIGKDPINPRAGIKSSYDLSLEWESWFGARILRCTNGLLMFKKLSNGGGKHRLSLDLEGSIAQMAAGMEKLDDQYGIWNNWLQIQMEETQAMKMLETSPLSEKQIENVLTLPEVGQHDSISGYFEKKKPINAWFLNSIVTQYFEHEMDDTPSRLALEERWTTHMHKSITSG